MADKESSPDATTDKPTAPRGKYPGYLFVLRCPFKFLNGISHAVLDILQLPEGAGDDDNALPLSALREHVPSKSFQWLLEAESSLVKEETEDEGFFAFGNKEEEKWLRVQEWHSSSITVDGIGGYNDSEDPPPTTTEGNENDLRIYYILSCAGGGHGDDLWAASRHVANRLANAEACRELLSPLEGKEEGNTLQRHPLLGLAFLELGAGAGLPSWTAMWRGANVVCTDQAIPDRIRCMAESVQRNWAAMNASNKKMHRNQLKAQVCPYVCPYDWGTPTTEITNALKISGDTSGAAFDVIVAADCIYMPEFHLMLLKSIDLLLSRKGVALLPFALHGNTQDSNVWGIIELAKQTGFYVEKLESLQLTPQAYGMDPKRALVHMLRLTRR